MRRYLASCLFAGALLCSGRVFAQAKAKAQNVPEIPYESVPNFLKMPPGLYLGEAMGVATNSKGHVFVYTRSANTRLFEFDQNGNYVREIGEGNYGFEFAHSVRVDPQDNIWAVDEGTNMVIKFNPAGRDRDGARPQAGGGCRRGRDDQRRRRRPPRSILLGRPTDVGVGPAGQYLRVRRIHQSPSGEVRQERPVPQAGGQRENRGRSQASSTLPHGIAVDAQGNVYVADRANHRMQVFDNNLRAARRSTTTSATSWTVCVSPGPHQYLFTSNSNPNGNPPGSWDITGEIYKMELDGTILGKFGHAEQAAGRIPGGSHDGLPQSERDLRGGNRVLARTETAAEATAGRRRRRPRDRTSIYMTRFLQISLAAIFLCGCDGRRSVFRA